jgi:DNA-binding beta-propeller fold protein YncE
MKAAISMIPVKGHVHGIAVSRNGEHAYVALSKSVAVLNGEHRVVASIPLPDHPKNLLMEADGKQLIVSQRAGSVSVVDTDTYTVKTLRDRCVSDVVVSPDGRYVYAVHRQASDRGDADVVAAIDIASGTTIFKIPHQRCRRTCDQPCRDPAVRGFIRPPHLLPISGGPANYRRCR